ncbi:MAG: hypothetical protein MUC83_02825 [Pirellula sp.]|jgi:hypothetical protein|nr:hypothetical protein [Pirellula sp.]
MRQWLIAYIDHAFREVKLDGGITIYEGESRDRYGDEAEMRLDATAERIDWRRIPVADLPCRHAALSFIDAAGFRFYTPAIMTVIVSGQDDREMLADAFLFHLHGIRSSCRVRETPYCELFNASQRAAIIRFLKFLAFSSRGYKGDDALRKTLSKLPACYKRLRNDG